MEEKNSFLWEQLKKEYQDELKIKEVFSLNRYPTFRVNTIKTTVEEALKILQKENFQVEKVSWCSYAFILKNKSLFELQNLSLYQNGEIYVQSLSSMLPPLFLNPKEKESILDMTAAPGSKTTQMAMITKNKANITACEKNKIRFERLKYNLEHQHVTCCTVLHEDARNLDPYFTFDKILLDAPCSGSGTIKDFEKEQANFTPEKIQKYAQTQLNLLRKALSLLKDGGELIYSTCSILKEENENVLKQIEKEFAIFYLPIPKDDTIPYLKTTISNTVCIAPNSYYEGFFIAHIRKEKCKS